MRAFEIPSVAQFQALRSWLITQGATAAQVAAMVGNAPQQRAMGTIADGLRSALKTLPTRQVTPNGNSRTG